jgi:hypothetical protein
MNVNFNSPVQRAKKQSAERKEHSEQNKAHGARPKAKGHSAERKANTTKRRAQGPRPKKHHPFSNEKKPPLDTVMVPFEGLVKSLPDYLPSISSLSLPTGSLERT